MGDEQALSDESSYPGTADERYTAVQSLGRSDAAAEEALRILRVALGDPSEDVRLVAVRMLEKFEVEEARTLLRKVALEGDKWSRRYAIRALRRKPSRADWPTLMAAVTDDDDAAAYDAIEGLGRVAGRGDVAELFSLGNAASGRRARELRGWAERIERRAAKDGRG